MSHAVTPRTSPVPAFLRTLLMLLMPLLGTLQAQQHLPMVAGNLAGAIGYHSYDVQVFAMEGPNGTVHGWIRSEHVYDNGTGAPVTHLIDRPVEELLVLGDKAYLRAGNMYWVFADHDAANTIEPDQFNVVTWVGPLAPVPMMLGFLNSLFNLFAFDVTHGNLHVQ